MQRAANALVKTLPLVHTTHADAFPRRSISLNPKPKNQQQLAVQFCPIA